MRTHPQINEYIRQKNEIQVKHDKLKAPMYLLHFELSLCQVFLWDVATSRHCSK